MTIEFTDEAVRAVARLAAQINQRTQNIGARRLHTVMEKLLEDISFNAPEMKDQRVVIDEKMVVETLAEIVEDEDLSRYIL